ncbi:diguanylate cyclase, partial [Escherichia coli]
FMNPVAEKMSGWTQEEALGVPLLTVLHITFGDSGPLMEHIYLSSPSRSAIAHAVVLPCLRGGSSAVPSSLTPFRPLDGRPLGSVLVLQDVPASRKMLRPLSYSASPDALQHLANQI